MRSGDCILVRLCSSFYAIHVHGYSLSAWSLTILVLHLEGHLETRGNPLLLTLAGGTAGFARAYMDRIFMFHLVSLSSSWGST